MAVGEVALAPASLELEGHLQLSVKLRHRRSMTRPILAKDPCRSGSAWEDGSTPEKATPSEANTDKQPIRRWVARQGLGVDHVSAPNTAIIPRLR